MNERLKIFCCYARRDQPLLFKLKTHLASFEREGLLSIWQDTDISPGTEWEEEINEHLNTAHIILLLISPDFMDSDYCYSKEMKQAMERHEKGEALVIPILIRPVKWQGAPFGKLQILPRNAQPVTIWRNRDQGLLTVAQGIEQSVRAWLKKSSTDSQLSQQIQETTSITKNTQDKRRIDSPDQLSSLSSRVTEPNTIQPKVTIHLSGDEVSDSHRDWGEAPDRSVFFGRTEELATLEQWIVNEQCRLVAIIGIGGIGKTELSMKLGKGGIGKTDLSLKLAQGIQNQFEYIIWRRLLSAPKITDILVDLIKFLSNQQEVSIPNTVEGQISRLLSHLRQHRCLLILDNVETILQGGKYGGQYLAGYEEYGQLFRQVAEVPHQSCLLLTSREKPPEIARLDDKTRPVRSLELNGLNYLDAKKIFAEIGSFSGSDEGWRELNEFYNGNPLALELAAKYINEGGFSGSISAFLKDGKPIFVDLHSLLDWHFDRLSDAQKEIMYWLAINGEPMSLSELKEDILSPIAKKQVPSTLQQLQRLLPLEKSSSGFTLQPVLIEYMTERLVNQIVEEIRMRKLELFHTFALLKALAKDYVMDSQVRLILKPIVEQMVSEYGKERSENKLKNLLTTLRETNTHGPSYAGGNILNILIELRCDLRSYDFSHLTIWRANLQGVVIPDVNFSHADLTQSVFTETFGSILAAAFSPNGEMIAGGTSGGEVRLWDAAHTRPFLTFQGHKRWVWAIAFSPDGRLLASGSGDQTVRLWDVSTGQELKLLQSHRGWVRSVAFSPDGRLLASGGEDQTVRLWDVSTGALLNMFSEYPGWIRTMAFSPDGRLLATGGEDQAVWLWEVSTGKCLNVLQSHLVKVRSLAFSRDGRMLVYGGLAAHEEETSLCFWDLVTASKLPHLKGNNKSIWSVAFSPDSKFIAVASSDEHSVRIWEVSTGECLHTLLGHRSSIRAVVFSPNGRMLVSGSEDQTLRIWDTSTGECHKNVQGFSPFTWSTAFSPDGKTIASGDEDHFLRLWEVRSGRVLKLLGHTFRITSVTFSPDGKMVASGSEDHMVCVWDAQNGSYLKTLRGHTHKVRSVAFSSDSSMLASGGEDKTVRLWDIRSGSEVKYLKGHTNLIWAVAFSPTENIVASGGADQTLRLWDTQTGQELKILRGHTGSIWSLAFSSDGAMIASGSADHTIRLWNTRTGESLKTLQGHTQRVKSVAFSPGGKIVVSGSEDLTIRLWEIESGNCLKSLQCSTDQIGSIAFSSDVQLLTCSTTEGAIHLLDISTGGQLRTFKSDRPYEHMNITGVRGLTEVQKVTLKTLGAFEEGNEVSLENRVLGTPPNESGSGTPYTI